MVDGACLCMKEGLQSECCLFVGCCFLGSGTSIPCFLLVGIFFSSAAASTSATAPFCSFFCCSPAADNRMQLLFLSHRMSPFFQICTFERKRDCACFNTKKRLFAMFSAELQKQSCFWKICFCTGEFAPENAAPS